MKQVNSPIEFYGDDFGADARLCHPSKEGILLWCPPAAAAFDHGRAISPSPSGLLQHYLPTADIRRLANAVNSSRKTAKSGALLQPDTRDEPAILAPSPLLEPIYTWFTEGFDVADLLQAKALLDKLD
jgi:hypothetical protein